MTLLCCSFCAKDAQRFDSRPIHQVAGWLGRCSAATEVSCGDAPIETVGCMRRVHFKLKSGAYAFTMLEDREFTESDRRPTDNMPNMASSEDTVDESPSTR